MEIRFVAWLIWRIHLAFRQMGVGGGMGCQFALAFLKNLPFAVVLELAEASQEAFDWLAEHFPDVNRENPGLQRSVTVKKQSHKTQCAQSESRPAPARLALESHTCCENVRHAYMCCGPCYGLCHGSSVNTLKCRHVPPSKNLWSPQSPALVWHVPGSPYAIKARCFKPMPGTF